MEARVSLKEIRTDKASKDKTSYKPVGAVISGLSILRYLGNRNTPVGVSQIARDVGINASTCYNILKTFLAEEVVSFNSETKRYALGLGLLDLAQPIISANNDLQLIQPRMKQVATEFTIMVSLWRRTDNEQMSLLAKADSDAAVRIHLSPGQRLSMWLGAMGRCMLAYSDLTESEFRSRFETLRWGEVPNFRKFMREARDVRTLGYAMDENSQVKGVTTLAVPVFQEEQDQPQLCLVATMFSGQHTVDEIGRLVTAMKDVSDVASRMTFK
ncbi:MAG: IclR family transcriptional regulator [Sneathiella sp.]|nr:IclR family transcriptional regulator [Sneathiella sp.]